MPFMLCVSAIGTAPQCDYVEPLAVARGNILLVDHGLTIFDEELEPVPEQPVNEVCEGEDDLSEIAYLAGRYRPKLNIAAAHVRAAARSKTRPRPCCSSNIPAPRCRRRRSESECASAFTAAIRTSPGCRSSISSTAMATIRTSSRRSTTKARRTFASATATPAAPSTSG